MQELLLFDGDRIDTTLRRLCYEIAQKHPELNQTVLIGLQPRGILLLDRIIPMLRDIMMLDRIQYGALDITFHRDDFRRKEMPLNASPTQIDFLIEDKNVILVDDVLFTGRSVRAALDALQSFGRPRSIELLVLVDRRYSRHLPLEATYVGKAVDTIEDEKVKVEWGGADSENRVILFSQNK